MSETIAVLGGTIIDASGHRRTDIRIADGVIDATGEGCTADTVLDATGCVVTPGLVDLAVHVRQPGDEAAETVESASRAAVLGGYTAIVAMPDTDPCIDSAGSVRDLQRLAADALCDVEIAGALTVDRAGTALAPMAEMAELGVRVFTDGMRSVPDEKVLRRALEYASDLDVTVGHFSESAAMAAGGHMHEGAVSSMLGIPGIPGEAEELMVMRAIALVQMTGARLHLHQLSTAGALGMVRAARAQGLAITCDVSPHHLVLTDAEVHRFDADFKLRPPLRPAADVEAVRSALLSGGVDAVATGHAPVERHLKEWPFDQAPFGAIGLETTLGVMLGPVGADLDVALTALSWGPAEIAGIADRHGGPLVVGRPANLTVIDPHHEWVVDASAGASLSRNTPFDGVPVRGRARHTVVNGVAMVIDGEAVR